MNKNNTVRRNLHVPALIDEEVIKFAKRNNLTYTSAFNKLVENGLGTEDVILQGGKVVSRYENREEETMAENRRGFMMRPALIPRGRETE